MTHIHSAEHYFVDSQANLLGELRNMSENFLAAEIARYHDKHSGKDILPEHADYPIVGALYRELFRRMFQKGKDYPVDGFISIDTTQPVNGTATMIFARRLSGRESEIKYFSAGFMTNGELAYGEVQPPTSSKLTVR